MINSKETYEKFLELIEKESPKKILDLGCGKGRLSSRFAKEKTTVLGVDNKPFEFKENNFKFLNQDIRDFKFEDKFDLIIASLVLHFFKKENALEILSKIKDSTSDRGLNFLVCMSDMDDLKKEKPLNFYPDLHEIEKIYSGWEIIKIVEGETEKEEHNNLPIHSHNLIFIIVKKLS